MGRPARLERTGSSVASAALGKKGNADEVMIGDVGDQSEAREDGINTIILLAAPAKARESGSPGQQSPSLAPVPRFRGNAAVHGSIFACFTEPARPAPAKLHEGARYPLSDYASDAPLR